MDEKEKSKSQPIFTATVCLPFHASKKNSNKIFFNKRTGQRFVSPSDRVKAASDVLLRELQARAIEVGLLEPIQTRVHAVLLFGFPHDQFYTKDLREKRTLGDCSNLAQVVEDALQKAGIVENDCLIAPLYVDRVISDKLCVSITLT